MTETRLDFKSGWALVAGATLAVCACGSDAAGPERAQERIRATVPALVDDTVAAFALLDESEAWASVGHGLASMDRSFSALPFSFWSADEETGEGAAAFRREEPVEESAGEAFARWLNDRIFIEASYEGEGVYLVRGESVCPQNESTGQPDAECVADVNEAELRVRAETAGDGLDLTLIVGPSRSEPVTIELRRDSLAVAVDLAEAKEAVVHLAEVVGKTLELPSVMEGVFALSLTRHAPRDVTIAVVVRRAIRVEGTLDGAPVAFSTSERDPLASLRADAVTHRLTAVLDVGPTTAAVPWTEVDSTSLASGTLAIDWKGLSGTAVLEEGARQLRLTGLGLGEGTSTVRLDGETLLAVDLNPASGRRFDLTIAAGATGHPIFALRPEIDLTVGVHLAPLAAAGDAVESYLLDETYRIAFTGDPQAQPVDADPATGFPGGLKVLAGRLSIESTAAPSPVVVSAGACLVGDDPVEPGEHPLLGSLASSACP